MTSYSKYNFVYRLQKWMDTVQGQTFLNYAYSWGASIVILGALFKLTHLPGANVALFLGMGTEVLVFFISAFDRPFDKTAEGREMPTKITEEFLESGTVTYTQSEETAAIRESEGSQKMTAASRKESRKVESSNSYAPSNIQFESQSSNVANPVTGSMENATTVAQEVPQVSAAVQPNYVPQMSAADAEALNQAQGNYVDELKKLVDTLSKVNEQSTRLTRDSEEMENLNRTLTGICKVYEMQLKGASQQIGTIDQINEQTKKMAQQIEQLNKIYARMISAMTVNMRAATPGVAPTSNEE